MYHRFILYGENDCHGIDGSPFTTWFTTILSTNWKTTVFGPEGTYARDLWWFVSLSTIVFISSFTVLILKYTGIASTRLVRETVSWISFNSRYLYRKSIQAFVAISLSYLAVQSLLHLLKGFQSMNDGGNACCYIYIEHAILYALTPFWFTMKILGQRKMGNTGVALSGSVICWRMRNRCSVPDISWDLWAIKHLFAMTAFLLFLKFLDTSGLSFVVTTVMLSATRGLKWIIGTVMKFSTSILRKVIMPVLQISYRKIAPKLGMIAKMTIQMSKSFLLLIRNFCSHLYRWILQPLAQVGVRLVSRVRCSLWRFWSSIMLPNLKILRGIIRTSLSLLWKVLQFGFMVLVQYPLRATSLLLKKAFKLGTGVSKRMWSSLIAPIARRFVVVCRSIMATLARVSSSAKRRVGGLLMRLSRYSFRLTLQTWTNFIAPLLKTLLHVLRIWFLAVAVSILGTFYGGLAIWDRDKSALHRILLYMVSTVYLIAAVLLVGRAARLSTSSHPRLCRYSEMVENAGVQLHSALGKTIVLLILGVQAFWSGAVSRINRLADEIRSMYIFQFFRGCWARFAGGIRLLQLALRETIFVTIKAVLRRIWEDPWLVLMVVLLCQVPAFALYQHRVQIMESGQAVGTHARSALEVVLSWTATLGTYTAAASVETGRSISKFFVSPVKDQLVSKAFLVAKLFSHGTSAVALSRVTNYRANHRDLKDLRALVIRALIKGFLGPMLVANLLLAVLTNAASGWSSVVAIPIALLYCLTSVTLSIGAFEMMQRRPQTPRSTRSPRAVSRSPSLNLKFGVFPDRKYGEGQCVICLENLSVLPKEEDQLRTREVPGSIAKVQKTSKSSKPSSHDTVDSLNENFEHVVSSRTPNIHKEGYLLKHVRIAGIMFRKRYYFVLDSVDLFMYSSRSAMSSGKGWRKQYKLDGAQVEPQGTLSFRFEDSLSPEPQWRYFTAYSEEDAKDWADALELSSKESTIETVSTTGACFTSESMEQYQNPHETKNQDNEVVAGLTNPIQDGLRKAPPHEQMEEAICPCGHCFHRKCIESWLTQRRHCPTCREGIRTVDVALQVLFH